MRTVAEVVRARVRGESVVHAEGEALDVLHDLEAAGQIGFLELAPLYAWIGARSAALRVFDEAVIRRDPWLPYAGRLPSFDTLRDSAEFTETLDSLGILTGRRSARRAGAPPARSASRRGPRPRTEARRPAR